MGILLCVLAFFAAALVAPLVNHACKGATGWVLASVPAAAFAYLASHIGADEPLRAGFDWVPNVGVQLSFFLDGLSLYFALLVSGVASVVFVYSSEYIRKEPFAGRFYSYMLIFGGAMLGAVLADDLITFYVFFELTSLTSFLLIGLEKESEEARRASRQALIVTTAGGFALLAGMLLLGQATETYAFSQLIERGDIVRASPFYASILALIAAGAFAKSAQIPFHVWLPNAMVAPTPVSAFLHAAAMVKAGIYLLARLHPAMGGTQLWTMLLVAVGGFTMLAAAWIALRQTELKRVLAYATIMALGLMIMLLGLGTEEAVKACLAYVLVHACYKAALFMTAGAVQHETGERDVRQIHGLRRRMPATFCVAVLAGLSMAGVPPLLGAISKELTYKALLSAEGLLAAAVLAYVALVAAAGVVALHPFIGRQAHGKTMGSPRFRVSGMWIAPAILALAALLFGLRPGLVDADLLGPAVASTVHEHTTVELHTWEGFTPEFLLGLLTLALGAAVFAVAPRLRTAAPLRLLASTVGGGPDRMYDLAQGALRTAAANVTAALQSGLLRSYLRIIFTAAAGLIGVALVLQAGTPLKLDFADVRFHEGVIVAAILIAAAAALRARSRLAVVLLLSTVSYGIGLVYILFGAPDLAMTQLLVETLLTILIVLAFVDLPELKPISSRRNRLFDLGIAAACGAAVTVIMLMVVEMPFDRDVVDYYTTNSYVLAHGRNIVNVILVDFRALDTLGEITVLATAGVSIFVVLRRRNASGDDATPAIAPADREVES